MKPPTAARCSHILALSLTCRIRSCNPSSTNSRDSQGLSFPSTAAQKKYYETKDEPETRALMVQVYGHGLSASRRVEATDKWRKSVFDD